MKVDLPDDITFATADGHEVRHLKIGWRLWRWFTWWRSRDRFVVTLTEVSGRERKIRVVGA